MNQVAVLITCFNRCEITLRCINHLFEIKKDIDVYLVDDNSTDGTSDAILKKYPQIHIFKGTGNLFWNKGMHLAWKRAAKKDYAYFLWLNDDVLLYENCFRELFECSKLAEDKAIISGIVESHDKTETLYGGSDQRKQLLLPDGIMKEITFLNGNVVLISKSVYNVLGNLDPVYHHDLGDVDYGLRAIENKIGVFTTRVAIASGEKNHFCRVRLNGTSLIIRFRKLYSPLGSNPNINFYFRKTHFGYLNAITYYFFIHFLNVLPDNVTTFIFKNRYK